MRKVFLDDLPKKKGFGANKDKLTIDWGNCVGRVLNFIYDDISGEIYIKDYYSKKQKLIVVYNNTESEIITDSFKNGAIGCVIGKINNQHIYKIGEVVNGVRILDCIKIKIRLGYKVQCVVDGYIRNINQYDLLNNVGCPVCSGHKVKKGINDLGTTHADLIGYFVNMEDVYKYSFGSEKVVELKCINCGLEKNMPIKDLTNQGFGCSRCSDGISYPNKFMFNLLNQLKMDFITEYSPEWAIDSDEKQRRYDFFIPSRNIIIEMDGGLHYKDRGSYGKTSQEILKIDKWKDLVAFNNGINVIRIDCNYKYNRFEYIKNNIIRELGGIFDISYISWSLINELALTNKVKEVCDLWNTKKYISSSKLCGDVNLSKYTVLRYLKIGNDLGWCKYDAKEQINKNNNNRRKYVKSKN